MDLDVVLAEKLSKRLVCTEVDAANPFTVGTAGRLSWTAISRVVTTFVAGAGAFFNRN